VKGESPVSVVTGATGRLGTLIVEELVRRGDVVVAVDVEEAALQLLARRLEGRCIPVRADVTVERDVERYVRVAAQYGSGVRRFANNAGIEGPIAPLTETPADEFRRVLEVNVTGVFLGLKHMLPALVRSGGGAVVNTASTAALHGTPLLGAYGASKHAVLGLTRTAATEHRGAGVRVNAVCPGPFESPMMERIGQGRGRFREGGAKESVLPDPKDAASVIVWLLCDAPASLTGQTIPVDGAGVIP
jgi:NAD(P)-dependent dehydrogenase (short-subunit alcohol dehydrogenase family)